MEDNNQENQHIELLKQAVQHLEHCITDEYDDRTEALDDFYFYQGDQWPSELRAERESNGRPCLTVNRIRQFVKQVVGDQRQNRPEPISCSELFMVSAPHW